MAKSRLIAQAPDDLAAQDADDPAFEIRTGLTVAGVFFVGFMGWAAAAPLDAAALISGTVTADGGPRPVQAREPGVVQAVHVREGDRVRKGQPLVDLASEDIRTEVRALSARTMSRRAEIARLQAERSGAEAITPWAGFERLAGEELAEAQRALAAEEVQLRDRRAARAMGLQMLRQRVVQGRAQLAGARVELGALQRQSRAIGNELRGVQSLAAQGYAPRLKVSELERSAAGLEGAVGARQAEVARLTSAVGEAELQIGEYDLRQQRLLEEELRGAQDDLRVLEPQLARARRGLAQAEVSSPASGRVFALKVNAAGGVVAAGEMLMRIVPDDQEMVIEGRLSAQDAAEVRVGQSAQISFPAFRAENLPILTGVITHISADSYRDERTGAPFFKVEVKTPEDRLAALRRIRGSAEALMPGLDAEMRVVLAKRTALEYALEPLTRRFSRSLHER